MNNIIEDLAIEANKFANELSETTGADFKKTFNAKYAELIINEAAKHIESKSDYEYASGESLKKHFGIEEIFNNNIKKKNKF